MITEMLVFVGLAMVVGVVFLALPLLRRPQVSAVRADYDMEVYRDQLGEVDRDLNRGLLTETQAEAARLELQRRLLAADSEAQTVSATTAPDAGVERSRYKTRLALAILLIVLLPVGTFAIYGVLGHPALPDRPFVDQQAQRLGVSVDKLESMLADADTLEADAQAHPKDQKRWLTLAQTRSSLMQPSKALIAYDQALALGPVSGEVWGEVGEANVQASDGGVSDRAKTAFVNALRQDRDDARSRYYLGMAEAQQGHGTVAIAIWRDLLESSAPDAPWVPMIRSRISQVAQQDKIPPVAVSPVHPLDLIDGKAKVKVDPDMAAAMAGAQADAARPDGQGFSAGEQSMVTGMVQRLKDRLADNPDDYQGWMRLGRSLRVMGDLAGSAEAYGKAAALKTGPDALEPLFNQALALIEQAQKTGDSDGPGKEFFAVVDKVEALKSDSPDALYLGGLADSLKGNVESARQKWTALLQSMPRESEARKALQRQIDGLAN